MGAPPGPISRGGRSGAPAGSLEGGRCTSSSHSTSPVPGAALLRGPGQPGQDRRGCRHKPSARNPARRPTRCPSSIHSRTSLPPGDWKIVSLRCGVVSPTGETAPQGGVMRLNKAFGGRCVSGSTAWLTTPLADPEKSRHEQEPRMRTSWERGRPARTRPATATPISPTSINRGRRRSRTVV